MTVLDALQATLADEHAAVYTYGVLGARTSQAASPALFDTLTAGYRRHRARRDQLRLMVHDAGGDPVAAEVAYDLAGTPLRPPQLERAAAHTAEQRGDLACHAVIDVADEAQRDVVVFRIDPARAGQAAAQHREGLRDLGRKFEAGEKTRHGLTLLRVI